MTRDRVAVKVALRVLLGACFESLALVPSGRKPAVPLQAEAGDWREANDCLEG
jgi:hypothetical protein